MMRDSKGDTTLSEARQAENLGGASDCGADQNQPLSPLSPPRDNLSPRPWAIDPETVDRWFQTQNPAPVPADGWTSDCVEERLADAIRYAQRTGGRAGPKVFGSAWPEYQHDWADQLAQAGRSEAERAEDARDRNRTRETFSTRRATLAEAALGWSTRYVENDDERRALALWLLGKATRKAWQTLAQRRGIARETAKRRKARAVYAILMGLTRDGVPVELGRY